MEEHPIFMWSFFFGLILASTYVVVTRTTLRTLPTGAGFLAGIMLGYLIVGPLPVETPQTWWMTFLVGAIAISAMILPGISGSFMLVILGQYEHVLTAVTALRFDFLLIFAAGCALGLALFSHLLSWLLARYHNITLALLAGLMLGSLRKIWPWKEAATAQGLTIERNILPQAFNTEVLVAGLLCLLGIAIVLAVHWFQAHRKEHSLD